MGEPPELDEWATRALHCWNWCGGWKPEAWPMYETLFPVPDWHRLTELMQVLRDGQS